MHLLTRDFEVIDYNLVDPNNINKSLTWQISLDEILSILSATSTIISNLTNSPDFSQRLSENFDVLSLMKHLINKLILETDFFKINELVSKNNFK